MLNIALQVENYVRAFNITPEQYTELTCLISKLSMLVSGPIEPVEEVYNLWWYDIDELKLALDCFPEFRENVDEEYTILDIVTKKCQERYYSLITGALFDKSCIYLDETMLRCNILCSSLFMSLHLLNPDVKIILVNNDNGTQKEYDGPSLEIFIRDYYLKFNICGNSERDICVCNVEDENILNVIIHKMYTFHCEYAKDKEEERLGTYGAKLFKKVFLA